jgi:thiamine-monophosphate kinase
VQSLAAWFLAEQPFMPPDDYLVYTYNRFQACRFGLDAVYVDPATGGTCRCAAHPADHGCISRATPAPWRIGALHVLRGETAAGQNDARWLRERQRESSCWPRSRARRRCVFGASMGEFDLIARFFTRPVRHAAPRRGRRLRAAAPAPGMQLAVSSDMLVEGRIFADVDPETLGHKALAVNLSDPGGRARPLAFTLALALPCVDEAWLQGLPTACSPWPTSMAASWSAATPRPGRSTSASPSLARCPRARRCCAAAHARATTSGSAARPGDARLALEALRGQMDLPAATLARRAPGWSAHAARGAGAGAARPGEQRHRCQRRPAGRPGPCPQASRVGAEIDVHITTDLLASGALQES